MFSYLNRRSFPNASGLHFRTTMFHCSLPVTTTKDKLIELRSATSQKSTQTTGNCHIQNAFRKLALRSTTCQIYWCCEYFPFLHTQGAVTNVDLNPLPQNWLWPSRQRFTYFWFDNKTPSIIHDIVTCMKLIRAPGKRRLGKRNVSILEEGHDP